MSPNENQPKRTIRMSPDEAVRMSGDGESDPGGEIIRRVREIPDLEPPPILLPSIMEAVRHRKLPWWSRLLRWARAPRNITITPIRAAPAAACVLVILTLSLWYLKPAGRVPADGSTAQTLVPVVFFADPAGARSVAVIGSFNDWKSRGYEMEPKQDGSQWRITLWLPAGRYEYAFLVDGIRIEADPRAGLYQEDGFGNQNSVLIVGNNHETAI